MCIRDRAWTVAIEDPDGGDYLGTVQIADQCVVTSGGYQRYFEQDGVRYWHILDPETGKPARSGMRSVTIVSAEDVYKRQNMPMPPPRS